MMKILLDTHALYWALSEPKLLSKAARSRISDPAVDEILVSAISIWEIAKLSQKQKMQLTEPIHQLLEKIGKLPKISIIDVDSKIAIESCNLPGEFRSDPGDEIIVATARIHRATILTKDQKIRDYPHVNSEW